MKAGVAKPEGHWHLSAEAFEALLNALADDRTRAAERYERIRAKLIRYFSWERCPSPEDCADDTLNRMARRILDGEEILNAESYSYGVARLVFKETLSREQREHAVAEELRKRLTAEDHDADDGRAEECLASCLAALTPEQRGFILEYYRGERRARIEARRQMADRLGLPLNAVRNRALRLREKLEACTLSCLANKRP